MRLAFALALALCASAAAYADYPLKLYEGPWDEDWIEWFEDAPNAFRWTTGSITTANQLLQVDARVTRALGPATLRYDHAYVSSLMGHVAYDPDAPRSDYGVFRADWKALPPYYVTGLVRMNYYKALGGGGLGIGRSFASGADLHVFALARLLADFIAAEEALERPERTVRYPFFPFDLYARFRGPIAPSLFLHTEAAYARSSWIENAPSGFPALHNQAFTKQEGDAKVKVWWHGDAAPFRLAARLLYEYRYESFDPFQLYRVRVSPDTHLGDASPHYGELLLRAELGHARAELHAHAGFLQWRSNEYVADHRDTEGAGALVLWMFRGEIGLSGQFDVEQATGKYPAPRILSHAERLLLPLGKDFRGMIEASFFAQADRTWNLTRYEIMWLY